MNSKIRETKKEFKKIIWPNHKTVTKEMILVIGVSVLIALSVSMVDTCLKFLIGIII